MIRCNCGRIDNVWFDPLKQAGHVWEKTEKSEEYWGCEPHDKEHYSGLDISKLISIPPRFRRLVDPYPYRACSVSCSSKYIIVIFCVIHDSCGTTAVKLRVSSSASSRTGASVIFVRDSPYVHLGNTRTSPVVFSCQYFSTLHVSTLRSAQVELMHQASVVRNDVSSARHSGVDISPPCPMCPPWAWSCLEQESRAGAMTARHENAHNGLYMLMPYPMKATDGAGTASKTSLRKVVGPISPSLSCYFYFFYLLQCLAHAAQIYTDNSKNMDKRGLSYSRKCRLSVDHNSLGGALLRDVTTALSLAWLFRVHIIILGSIPTGFCPIGGVVKVFFLWPQTCSVKSNLCD